MNTAGRHVTADIWLKEPVRDLDILQACFVALDVSGMNTVKAMSHKFEPQGMTVVWILEESHFTLHTFPEEKYISVDCYTCGKEGSPTATIQALLDRCDPEHTNIRTFDRGRREGGSLIHKEVKT